MSRTNLRADRIDTDAWRAKLEELVVSDICALESLAHRLLDATDAERARAEKAEAEGVELNRRLNDALDAKDAEIERWRQNSIETWQAMQAMRNSINEHVPMPSVESDLLQGPENSVFCLTVVKAVVAALDAERGRAEKAEAERDQALARLAGAYEVAEELCKRRYHYYEQMVASAERSGPSHPEYICDSTYHHWSGRSSAYYEIATDIRKLTPADAEAALQRVVDATWMEGWRAGREAAARYCVLYGQNLVEGEWGPEGMAVMLGTRIRSLPEPMEDNHE